MFLKNSKSIWGITGSGRFLEKSIKSIRKLNNAKNNISILLSLSGEEVIEMYNESKNIEEFEIIKESEQSSSYPFIGGISMGKFDHVIISPCSANTIAKITYGISDSLITNAVSQALKSQIKTSIVPTDIGEKSVSKTPNGEKVRLKHRKVDRKNIEKLRETEINIYENPDQLLNNLV